MQTKTEDMATTINNTLTKKLPEIVDKQVKDAKKAITGKTTKAERKLADVKKAVKSEMNNLLSSASKTVNAAQKAVNAANATAKDTINTAQNNVSNAAKELANQLAASETELQNVMIQQIDAINNIRVKFNIKV